MKYSIPLLTTFLALSLNTPTYGAEDEGDDLFFFDDEIPVVLTSSRLKQPITEAPTAMTIIDRKRIKQSGAREIAELFQLVPGMTVGFQYGDWPIVAYHGMSDQYSRRMQVLIDGRAVYLPDSGGPDWSSLPIVMDDIERIEITRGSNSATFGSNSFMGVINIITQHSSKSSGQYISYTQGDNEVKKLVARHGQQLGDFDYRVTLKEEESNYYNKPQHFQSSTIATLRADYQITRQDHLMYQTGYTDKLGNDRKGGVVFPHTTKRYFHQFEWSQTHALDHELKVQLYYSNHKRYNSFKVNDSNFGLLEREDNVYNQRYDFEMQYSFSAFKKLRGVVGMGSRKDKLTAPLSFGTDNTFEIDTQRLFSTLEYRASADWLLHFGGVIEAHNAMSKRFSPRVTANYKRTKSETLRIGISRAYRAPLAFERYADRKLWIAPYTDPAYLFAIEPDVNVKAEEITSFDLGYIIKERKSPYTLDFRLYREKLKQLISPYGWQPADNLLSSAIGFANNTNATIQGFESSIEYKKQDFNALLNYSYTDIVHHYFGSTGTPYSYSNSAPKHKASILLAKTFKKTVTASAIYHYVSDFLWLGAGDQIEAYTRLDLKIEGNLNIRKNNLSIAAVIQNALSDEHFDFDNANNFTRRFYVTLAMEID